MSDFLERCSFVNEALDGLLVRRSTSRETLRASCGKVVFLVPVGNRGAVQTDLAPNLLKREALCQPAFQKVTLHGGSVMIASDRTYVRARVFARPVGSAPK